MTRTPPQGRPIDVCALCDTPIEDMASVGFDGPHRMTVTWDRGLHGTRSAYIHVGCGTLGQGQYDHQRDPARGEYARFEDTPLFELTAAWARRTFAGQRAT